MTNTEKFEDLFKGTLLEGHTEDYNVALDYWLENNPDDYDAENFVDWFSEEYVWGAEIIYYHVAMEFLAEHDPSLTTSLGVAEDSGYEVGTLNSEALASLLLQDMLNSELDELRDEIQEHLATIEERQAA